MLKSVSEKHYHAGSGGLPSEDPCAAYGCSGTGMTIRAEIEE